MSGPLLIELSDVVCDGLPVWDMWGRAADGPDTTPCCDYRLQLSSGSADACRAVEWDGTYYGKYCCEAIPAFANLIIESVRTFCDCDWNQQQEYECELGVRATIRNAGDAPSAAFWPDGHDIERSKSEHCSCSFGLRLLSNGCAACCRSVCRCCSLTHETRLRRAASSVSTKGAVSCDMIIGK